MERVSLGRPLSPLRPRVALFSAFVDRVFTRPIAGRTLAAFKALAEALVDESGPSTSTNLWP